MEEIKKLQKRLLDALLNLETASKKINGTINKNYSIDEGYQLKTDIDLLRDFISNLDKPVIKND